ncbi:hypothetical protein BDR22DRAFT_601933 [Usnea florida]
MFVVLRTVTISKERLYKTLYALKISRSSILLAKSLPLLSVMYPSASTTSLWLLMSLVALSHGSVEFFIYPAIDLCSKGNIVTTCYNNTDRGGLCAYAPDVDMVWCCPAPDNTCWGYARSCSGGSFATPGPGQIACSYNEAEWCCNEEYETCSQIRDQINTCETKFASANANVSIAEANAIESSSTSSRSPTTTPLSSISSTSSTISDSKATTSSSSPVSSPSTSANASGSSLSESSPSSSDHASTHLSSGAIAGIVIAAVVAVSCLVGIAIMLARREKGNPKAHTIITEKDGAPANHRGSRNVELDARGQFPELPAQGLRQEMMS